MGRLETNSKARTVTYQGSDLGNCTDGFTGKFSPTVEEERI